MLGWVLIMCYTYFHMKNPWVIVGVLAAVLFGGATWYSGTQNDKSNEGVVIGDYIKGNPEATVTLVEYSDFQCPACAAFQPVVKDILSTYGDKIRFEYRHYPLPIHNFSQQAAVAVEAAGQQDKFYEFHDKVFENQKEWSSSATPQAFFIKYAQELGLDVELFKTHLKSSILRDEVRNDLNKAKELGLTSTPTFYLNGEKMQIETFEDFVGQIVFAVDPTAGTNASGTPQVAGTPEIKFGI
jgi:protein-disulfide isomerase